MMRIWKMRMGVRDGVVPMRMDMTRARVYHVVMNVIVVRVARAVHMRMGVLKRLVGMRMLMAFCQMQPDPPSHQCACHDQLRRDRLAQDRNGQGSTDKRRNGEISARAGCPEVAQAQHKQGQARPVTGKAQHCSG